MDETQHLDLALGSVKDAFCALGSSASPLYLDDVIPLPLASLSQDCT